MTVSEADRTLAKALAESLRRHRKKTGLSQEKLAHAAGIDWKYYQNLENEKSGSAKGSAANPTIQILWKLSGAYGVSLPDLINDAFGGRNVIEYRSGDDES